MNINDMHAITHKIMAKYMLHTIHCCDLDLLQISQYFVATCMHVVVYLILQVSPLKHDHGMNVNRLSHVMAMEFGRGVIE